MKFWKRKPGPEPEENPLFKDGKLTEKGKEFAARYIRDSTILGSGPQPINFAAQGSLYGQMKDAIDKFHREQDFRRLLEKLSAQGLSFNPVPSFNPGPVTPRTPPVNKIPVSGMAGFSESGQPAEWDLAIGEITGYRWWKVRVPARFAGYQNAQGVPFDPDSELKVTGQNNYCWEPGVLEARCSQTYLVHEPPEIRVACGCGFWGYFDPHLDVYNHFTRLTGKYPHRPYGGHWAELPVFGVIKASGRVIVGEKGFRSQYAEIAALCIPEATRSQLSWWTDSVADLALNDGWGNIKNSTTYRAMVGAGGWYAYDDTIGSMNVVEAEPATHTEVLARLATLETWLGNAYPGCRVFTDEESMTGYFPPDNNYRG